MVGIVKNGEKEGWNRDLLKQMDEAKRVKERVFNQNLFIATLTLRAI